MTAVDELDADYVEPLNPVEIEQAIQRIRQRIARGVRVVSDAERAAKQATRDFDLAYAHAFLDHDGPQTEKKHAATVDTIDQRDARDVAVLAYRHAERLAEGLQDELRAYQSLAKSVTGMYGSETGFGR